MSILAFKTVSWHQVKMPCNPCNRPTGRTQHCDSTAVDFQSATGMAGRGRGRGRGPNISFDVESLGFGRGEALPTTNIEPRPSFPVILYYRSHVKLFISKHVTHFYSALSNDTYATFLCIHIWTLTVGLIFRLCVPCLVCKLKHWIRASCQY